MSDPQEKRPVGRPRTITDMKAYKRDKARQYRSEIKAGKRVPKRKGETT